jgi:hypothetical protein
MTDKETIIKSIDYLKKEIQYIIDKRKSCKNTHDFANLDAEKREKIDVLSKHSESLKSILKTERDKKRHEDSLTAVTRAVDSLEFASAKRNVETAKQAKQLREKVRQKYEEYLDYEAKYSQIDPKDVPGALFLHDNIVRSYGLCPYIKFDIDTESPNEITEQVRLKRLEWLESQGDKGLSFFDLYNRIVVEKEIREIKEEMANMEVKVTGFATDSFLSSQQEIFESCSKFIEEFISSNIKTKRIKERYKVFINDLSVLYYETGVPVHEYFSLKYKQHIVVNDIGLRGEQDSDHHKRALATVFMDLVKAYGQLVEDYDQQHRYIWNTMRNIKNEMYMFLTGQRTSGVSAAGKEYTKAQQGKFFRRWSVLTREEQADRLMSFAEYFVQRHMERESVCDKNREIRMIAELGEMLKTAYEEKRLIYRNFKWNTNRGMIEAIHVLQYSKDTDSFALSKQAGNHKAKTAAKPPPKSVLTPDVTKTVNDEILAFVLKKEAECTVDGCVNHLKTLLKVKVFTPGDLATITGKFETVLRVVERNSSE